MILASQVWLYNCSQWWFWQIRFDITETIVTLNLIGQNNSISQWKCFIQLDADVLKLHVCFVVLTAVCLVCCTGVQAFADALLVIIKVLAQNSGLDPQEAIVKLQEEYTGPQMAVGLDIKTGIPPLSWNFSYKTHCLIFKQLRNVIWHWKLYLLIFIFIRKQWSLPWWCALHGTAFWDRRAPWRLGISAFGFPFG